MEASQDCSVKVAVHIRPLIGSERLQGCKECVIVTPGQPQVQIGSHLFTFDHVYGNGGSPSSSMFEECVAPLVDGLFQGYNGTVLAYGQTGSGKTHTMGTSYKDGFQTGLIPQFMNTLCSKIQSLKHQSEFQLHVSFIEILNEEVRDLLDPVSETKSMIANGHSGKVSVTGRPLVQIRESSNGVITLAGSSEVAVSTLHEMVACLEHGSVCRATGSTNVNNQSSRSHAIFTITLEQMRKLHSVSPVNDTPDEVMGEEYICAKLHLVDLAGSERAKRTGSDGLRLKEGIHINRGLLALGNVISALGDEKRRKAGVHVPYRDSKLTRLLQDSLGGNSKTVMIACISPADINAEETLNTLKYANRARNIQNKPVVNRDLISSELQQMRQQIKHLQEELSARGAPSDEVKVLKQKFARLEASNEALSRELHEYRSRCSAVEQRRICPQGGYANSARSDGLKRDFQSMHSSDYRNYEVNSDEHASLQSNDKSFRRLLNHDLEIMVNVHEVRFQYEKQKQEHSRLEGELTLLKQADQLDPNSSAQKERNDELGFPLMSPCSRMERISSLENMLSISSNALMAMASQLSEAEEREHSLISPGRWNQLCSMAEAKNLLDYMFATTAEARCQMWDKEMEIKDLTDQMKELINVLQQNEAQIKELVEEHKIREQAISIALAQSVSGSSCSSSAHNLDDLSGPLSARSLPTPKQLKFSPGVATSVRDSTAFVDNIHKIVPVEHLPMKKLAASGQTGKLLQFKWKWQKPWKLSEWMKHSDETIMKSRPYGQFLVDVI